MAEIRLQDNRGAKYRLATSIGKGGEATVYRLAGRKGLLAKLYTKPSADRERKIAWMISNPPDDPGAKRGHTSIAWPLRLVYGPGGFAGYLMPHIRDTVPLLKVFHPRLRGRTFRGFTRHHLHNTAYNIAAALGAIHERGYVVGDLNESNILVARSTLVTVIDTDSFQVHARTKRGRPHTHLCTVAKPEYMPPEMQGADLKKTVRLPEHDRFALAVLIYQLLMNGSHPFRAGWKGSGEKPGLPERIKKGYFPSSARGKGKVEPTGDLQILYPPLADLFRRCFIQGHVSPRARPSPAEWEQVLSESMHRLVPCGKGHVHSPHLERCPECERGPLPVRGPVTAARPGSRTTSRAGAGARRGRISQQPGSGNRPVRASTTARRSPGPVARILRRPGSWLQSSRASTWLRRSPAAVWLRRQRSFRLSARQPGVWAIAGLLLGGLLGTQVSAITGGRALGALGGLVTGAFAGAVIEKRVGWEAFFGGLGALAGLLVWSWVRTSEAALGWLAAAGAGGLAGILAGRYGRLADLTLLWAGFGAVAGWYLGQAAAGLASPEWLAAALSGGVMGLVSGVAYAVWRRYG